MALSVLKDVRKIYAGLNAEDIRDRADKEIRIGLMARSEAGYAMLERFLAPAWLGEGRRQALSVLHRVNGGGDRGPDQSFDFILCEPGIPLPAGGHVLDPTEPWNTANEIAAAHSGVELALARTLPQFREPVAHRIVQRVAKENALFALVTALPNVLPSFIELPWALGEFATDTAFLTMNQVRMSLMMAALNDRDTGYREQKLQIAAIVGGAFGWRALARELVGKIPLGGGLIPKAGIAFAGTWLVGMGLERLNRTGVKLTREERKQTFTEGFGRGTEVAREMVPVIVKRP